MTDHASRARAFEEALDWKAAGRAWQEAEREGHEAAQEGVERARKALSMIEELCDLAEMDLDDGDLKAAREPLETAGDLAGKEHPRIVELRKRWLRERRERLRRRRKSEWVAGLLVFGVVLGVVVWLAPQELPEFMLELIAGGAALVAVAICYALIPALRKNDVRWLRLRAPANWKAGRKTGKAGPRSVKKFDIKPTRSRALEEWRRNAAQENQDRTHW